MIHAVQVQSQRWEDMLITLPCLTWASQVSHPVSQPNHSEKRPIYHQGNLCFCVLMSLASMERYKDIKPLYQRGLRGEFSRQIYNIQVKQMLWIKHKLLAQMRAQNIYIYHI